MDKSTKGNEKKSRKGKKDKPTKGKEKRSRKEKENKETGYNEVSFV